MSNRKLAAAYIRVSTDDQIEFSPDSQIKKAKEYASKNNLILPDKFVFMDEGISGRNAKKRPAFNEMISLAKSKPKPFDVIIVWKFSRFARNQEESIVYKSMLKKQCGIEVISISEPIIDGPFGELIERIIEWSDEYYSINLAQEVKRGMTEKASRGGVVSIAPFGYKNESGTYIPDSNAPYVSMIFNDFCNGMGCRAIAKKYSDMGVRNRNGNMLDNRFIEYLLRNPAYIGKIRWSTSSNGASARHFDADCVIIADGTHQPLISEETFNMAQDKLNQQKRSYVKYQRKEQTVDFMLKGLLRCSNCGATLCCGTNSSVQCHNYSRGSCQVSHSLSINKANTAVIDALTLAVTTESFNIVSKKAHSNDNDKEIDKLIDEQNKRLERARIAYTEGIDTLEEYRKSKTEIQRIIQNLKNKQSESEIIEIDISKYKEKVKSVLDTITNPDITEELKNKALRTILTDIIYKKSDKCLLLNFYV